MEESKRLRELGFSQYEASCYMALISKYPTNGSQLSKLSGISRSRIYDVLRKMVKKEMVVEVESGLYAPLPPDELVSRLKSRFNSNIKAFEDQLQESAQEKTYEFIWTIRGYMNVIKKASEMIQKSKKELYVRLFPKAAKYLEKDLLNAADRGVIIRYISMGEVPKLFDIQVVHPDQEHLVKTIGGRSFDIIVDKKEALVGIFEKNKEDSSPINWTRNKWFITANRDSLRHDFFHFFLQKTYDNKESLSSDEIKIYEFIKKDV